MSMIDRRRLLLLPAIDGKFYVFKEGEGFVNDCGYVIYRWSKTWGLYWDDSHIELSGNQSEDLTTEEEEDSPVAYDMVLDSVNVAINDMRFNFTPYVGTGFDFSRYKKLCIEYRSPDGARETAGRPYGYAGYMEDATWAPNSSAEEPQYITPLKSTQRTIVKINISSITGNKLIYFEGPKGRYTTYVYNVWFE